MPSGLAVVERRNYLDRVNGQPLEARVVGGQRQARVLDVSEFLSEMCIQISDSRSSRRRLRASTRLVVNGLRRALSMLP